jgi:hypothetical protein
MKNIFLLVASLVSLHLRGQIISTANGGSLGNIIWYCTFSVNADRSLGLPVCNYQAGTIKDVNNNKHLIVVNSNNWLAGTKAYPNSMALYETPGNVAIVVPDYANRVFKFYNWNVTSIAGPPHHTNPVLNFIGNDKQPYTISFADFAGR